MQYKNITRGRFIDRPNRLVSHVEINGKPETVHVKNTGRCTELLLPGAEVYLTESGTPDRKTRYDLVAVRKANGILFNIDSQAPNKVVKEWQAGQAFDKVVSEYTDPHCRGRLPGNRRLCDPDGRRDRGSAQYSDTPGICGGIRRGSGSRRADSDAAMSCGAGQADG